MALHFVESFVSPVWGNLAFEIQRWESKMYAICTSHEIYLSNV